MPALAPASSSRFSPAHVPRALCEGDSYELKFVERVSGKLLMVPPPFPVIHQSSSRCRSGIGPRSCG
jgi:hypothetical protein